MGLLDTIVSAVTGGNTQQMQSIASGQGNFSDPNSPDHAGMSSMVSQTPQGILSQIFSKVAGQMNPQSYSDHVTPGVGGTNPLGGLKGAALTMIATALVSKLAGSGGAASLLGKIPGLGTADPAQMNPQQVAQVAQYTQQNHPDLFGQATAEVAQKDPSLLSSLLGHAGLSQSAMALASHFLQPSK